jgi:2-hydroxy-3-keto-5-methylthiopentenyl-1-phosphate phosphatase
METNHWRAKRTMTPMLFLDFDGTISNRDAVDLILEKFADARWLAVEEDWRAGRIGSRECLTRQMALVRAAPRELDQLLATIELDAGLGALLETCALFDVQAGIVSDGFDYCIRRILARAGSRKLAAHLRHVRVYANHLAHAGGGRWRTEFPFFRASCAHGCATCKPAVMEMLNPRGAATIFVGDGLSDVYAAREADLVFAKKSLARLCRERAIDFAPYETLADVAARLEDVVHDMLQFARGDEETRVRA